MKRYVFLSTLVFSLSSPLFATPTTQIWNPSTDIQAAGTFHLGIDDYFSVVNNKTGKLQGATILGLTYGAVKGLEVGVDIMNPTENPVYFNAKYGIPESGMRPAFAVGGFNFGTEKGSTDQNIVYGLAAKSFAPAGRISLGYYQGNEKIFADEKGSVANSGIIATWDKTLTDKVWVSVDHASGMSAYGSTSLGFSYAFAPNTSVIFGYVIYNNRQLSGVNDQLTTQLDINF